jgi:hypothetical protein
LFPRCVIEGFLLRFAASAWHCQVVGDDIVTRQQQALSGRDFRRPDA